MSEVQEFIQLGEVAEITMGQSPDASGYNTDERGLPFLQGCEEFGKYSPSTNVYCSPPLRTSKPNSILISVRAPVGKTNWGEQSYCIGRGLAAIKARPEYADTNFISYAINQSISFLHHRSQGSTFLAIGAHDLKIFPVPSISCQKQQKISSILESIDRAIAHTEALIEKYPQIKAGLIHDLFTRGIGADGKLRPSHEEAPELYQESAIGWIPREWKLSQLSSTYKYPIRDFGSFSSTNLIAFLEEGIPFIKSEMIKEEEVDWTNLSYISQRVHVLLAKSHVKSGQILFSKIGSALGKAVLYSGDRGICNSNAAIAKIEADESIVEPQFLEIFLNSSLARKQFELMIVSLLPRINLGDINKLLIQLPEIAEQKLICSRYDSLKKKIRSEKKSLHKLYKQKQGLMRDLLTGKVLVKANPDEVEP
ncbi:MAG: restriction endonuclease subunit S [Cyanophyceae cyanobacterium]